jgi:hypothetical protein
MLSIVLLAAILGSLVVSFVLLLGQLAHEAVVQDREVRAATARRLRYVHDDTEVVLIPPSSDSTAPRRPGVARLCDLADTRFFHLFLSHVWGTGQDQMRIVKQRMREMLPDVEVFLGATHAD